MKQRIRRSGGEATSPAALMVDDINPFRQKVRGAFGKTAAKPIFVRVHFFAHALVVEGYGRAWRPRGEDVKFY